MIILILLLLAGTAWGLWNVYQKVNRLDVLIAQWEETLAILQSDPQASSSGKPPGLEDASDLRVIIEITDAVGLAKSYHWAGGAGALAPAVLKKAMQSRVLEETNKAMQEGGHKADVKVIVL